MRLFSNNIPPFKPFKAKKLRFRYGKDFAISSNSDIDSTNTNQMEFYSVKYGVRSTIYEESSGNAVVKDVYKQNAIEESLYFPTDKVYSDRTIIFIPDYYNSTYSASGAAFYEGVSIGDPKPLRYPNNGTQMMYMTNGRIGVKLNQAYSDWDKGVGSIGINNPAKDPINTSSLVIESTGSEGDGFSEMFNIYSRTSLQGWRSFAYRQGQQGTWQGQQIAIGGRNSESGGNVSGDYFDDWLIENRSQLSSPSSTRITDTFFTGDNSTRVAWIKDKIDNVTSISGGWFRNFTHFWSADMSLMEAFYTMLGTYDNAWFCGMSEAVDYRWIFDMVTKIDFLQIDNNTLVSSVVVNNKYGLNLNYINDKTISCEIDLTGTLQQGLDIQTDVGKVVKLGDDKWIVDVAINRPTKITAGTPNYYDLDKPSVLSSVLVGSDLTITTDQETRVTLFSDEVGTVIERKYIDNNTHVFTGITTGTYYLGVMNNTNRTIVETITI